MGKAADGPGAALTFFPNSTFPLSTVTLFLVPASKSAWLSQVLVMVGEQAEVGSWLMASLSTVGVIDVLVVDRLALSCRYLPSGTVETLPQLLQVVLSQEERAS